jgi:hypothetical protein
MEDVPFTHSDYGHVARRFRNDFCNVDASTVVQDYRRHFQRQGIQNRHIHRTILRQLLKNGRFPVSPSAESTARRDMSDMGTHWKSASHSTRRNVNLLHVPRTTVRRTEGFECLQKFSISNLETWVGGSNTATGHFHSIIIPFYSPTGLSLPVAG